jgi:MFS family permease
MRKNEPPISSSIVSRATAANVNQLVVSGGGGDSIKDEESEKDDDTIKGYSEYAFKWCCLEWAYLTRTATWRFVFVTLCVCNFVENMVTSGVATVILSTIEREFFLSSVEGGLFLAAYEVGAFVASPFCGYVGNRYKKMRLLGLSMLVVTIGCCMCSLAAFLKKADFELQLFDPNATIATLSSYSSSLCVLNSTQAPCSSNDNNSSNSTPNLHYLLYGGHFIIGLASVAMYTVGIAYVEEITLPNESAYCQAILYGCGMIFFDFLLIWASF